MISFTAKENHIGQARSEILHYWRTFILLLLYYDGYNLSYKSLIYRKALYWTRACRYWANLQSSKSSSLRSMTTNSPNFVCFFYGFQKFKCYIYYNNFCFAWDKLLRPFFCWLPSIIVFFLNYTKIKFLQFDWGIFIVVTKNWLDNIIGI